MAQALAAGWTVLTVAVALAAGPMHRVAPDTTTADRGRRPIHWQLAPAGAVTVPRPDPLAGVSLEEALGVAARPPASVPANDRRPGANVADNEWIPLEYRGIVRRYFSPMVSVKGKFR